MMGGALSRKRTLSSDAGSTSRECEKDGTNGFIFTAKNNKCFFPNEVLTHILSYVDTGDLRRNCILVCQNWNNLIKYEVWKTIAERKLNKRLGKLPWKAYQNLCLSDAFDKNLIKNSCGEQEMDFWNVLRRGGHGWVVEQTPCGCEPLPEDEFGDITSCYATSYSSCCKEQTVNLMIEGISPKVMDQLQPKIYVSEWVGTRFDCGCIYELLVTLLDSEKEVLKKFNYRFKEGHFQGGTWHKVEHTFENYGPGVRYINFFHGGQDTKFWAGYYGSKMSKATVKVLIDFSKTNDKGDNKECDNEVLVVKDNAPNDTSRRVEYPSDSYQPPLQFGFVLSA